MPDTVTVSDQIAAIETRQDEVLRQLDELNLLLERAIAEWMGGTKAKVHAHNDQPLRRTA